MPGSVELSLVIPVYNERDNLAPLLEEIAVALHGASYEVVAVDDGSTDGSLAELKRLAAAHPELHVVAFERNAGQTAAFAAGFRAARGAILVTLDADLQNDPADIPALRPHQVREVEPRLARARGRVRGALDAAPRAQVPRDRGMALMPSPRKPRLDPSIFNLPVEKMKAGYYSDKYFVRARDLLLKDRHRPCVTMQVFGKAHAYLGGSDEAIAILKLCSEKWEELQVSALYDGDEIAPWETVLLIEGPYDAFANLETLYLGVLARRTKVGTNTHRVVEAAKPKQVMFFPARHDHWLVQTGDGYAAHIAGAIGVSTDAQASWWGSEGIGTVPHALIAAYRGDTVLASQKFAEHMPDSMRLITLVDFENDCVGTSLKVARALGQRLYGVRIDTSETLVDRSVIPQMGTFKPTGVNPRLVWNVREALDREGFKHVKIVVSGGFNVEKIRQFEEQEVPVDMYGVGSSLFQGRFDFTADVVRVEGKPCGKVGRAYRPNPRLERVE